MYKQIQLRVPHLSSDLIDKLNKDYPERHPDLTLSDREIWFNAGRRHLINQLLQHQTMDEADNNNEVL